MVVQTFPCGPDVDDEIEVAKGILGHNNTISGSRGVSGKCCLMSGEDSCCKSLGNDRNQPICPEACGGFAQPCLKVYRTTTKEGNRKHLVQNQNRTGNLDLTLESLI